jgi:hypothetical protein
MADLPAHAGAKRLIRLNELNAYFVTLHAGMTPPYIRCAFLTNQ